MSGIDPTPPPVAYNSKHRRGWRGSKAHWRHHHLNVVQRLEKRRRARARRSM